MVMIQRILGLVAVICMLLIMFCDADTVAAIILLGVASVQLGLLINTQRKKRLERDKENL